VASEERPPQPGLVGGYRVGTELLPPEQRRRAGQTVTRGLQRGQRFRDLSGRRRDDGPRRSDGRDLFGRVFEVVTDARRSRRERPLLVRTPSESSRPRWSRAGGRGTHRDHAIRRR
jgi:hypothetical protein